MSYKDLKTCAECGIEFREQYSDQTCCTELCKDEHERKKNVKKIEIEKKKRMCRHCKESFIPKAHEVFCSNDCEYVHQRNIKECRNCKKSFIKKSKEETCCSVRCDEELIRKTTVLHDILMKTDWKIKVDVMTLTEYKIDELEDEIEKCKVDFIDLIEKVSVTKKNIQKVMARKEYCETMLKLKKMVDNQSA